MSVRLYTIETCGEPNLRSESRWLLEGAKQLGGFCSLHVSHFLVVEEAHRGAAPYDPISIMLYIEIAVSKRTPNSRERASPLYLLPCDGVVQQRQMGELGEMP